MNWLTNFVRPKINAIVKGRGETEEENLWEKCPACAQMIFHRELEARLRVCGHCGHHLRVDGRTRLTMLFDDGEWTEIPFDTAEDDPLKFRDRERYSERLKAARAKTRGQDAVIVAVGTIDGVSAVAAILDFSFMGGSMGASVGNGMLAAADAALERKAPLIAITASGGARMQEGALSLMQMPRTVIAVQKVKEAGLPYIVLLGDPTTGGVSASFAMLGDVHITEPGAQISFAGARVIEQTVGGVLPEGFQTAEYLLEHGMVDMIVPRSEQRETLGRLIRLLAGGGASQERLSAAAAA